MSYSFSRDRTAELKNDRNPTSSDDEFRPNRKPITNTTTSNNDNRNQAVEETIEMIPLDLSTTAGFFDYVDRLKYDIDAINHQIDQIGNLHHVALSSFNEQQSKKTATELERIKANTQHKNMDIKNRLQALEHSNSRILNAADHQMRATQTATIKKRFIDTIQRYQDVERNYQLKYRQRIERQIRIVKPDANQDEIDDIIDSDDTHQVFAQSLMNASRVGQSKAVLSEVQTRHQDIKHIEKTIVELHQLFMDMQMMVEQQAEVLNTVEQNAEIAATNVKEGNTQIDRAITLARSTRAKKWCCFFICIGLCVMIAILVWWFGFGHPGIDDDEETTSDGHTMKPDIAWVILINIFLFIYVV